MGFFSRLFEGRQVKEARALRAAGDLERAGEAFRKLGDKVEAARLFLAACEGESNPRERLRLIARAIEAAPPDGALLVQARTKRALLVLREAEAAEALSPLALREIADAAPALLAGNEPAAAARAYRLVGDLEGAARAYEAAGDIDNLESLLDRELAAERRKASDRAKLDEAELLATTGLRRDALAILRALGTNDDVKTRIDALERRRPKPGPLAIRIRGVAYRLLTEKEVTIGRTTGVIVPSPEVSRVHVLLSMTPSGVLVKDLGSRNGTKVRGSQIDGTFAISDSAELELGPSVRLVIARVPFGWSLTVGGESYLATFGECRLDDWSLRERDGWFELEIPKAWLSGLEVTGRVHLLVGDRIERVRHETPPTLEVLAHT